MKPKKVNADRVKLEKELREAVKDLDEKGLLFLLRQAHVLISNSRIDKINEHEQGPGHDGADDRLSSSPPKDPVSIEDPKNGKAIFLNLGPARKVLTPEEMKRLVRICYGAESKGEALRRLFTVLVRERKDILADARIGNPDNPLLDELFTVVRASYRLDYR